MANQQHRVGGVDSHERGKQGKTENIGLTLHLEADKGSRWRIGSFCRGHAWCRPEVDGVRRGRHPASTTRTTPRRTSGDYRVGMALAIYRRVS
jgi:hypothetical protein